MQIEVVAEDGGGNHRVRFVLLGQLLERVVGLGVDHRALFNPADFVLLGLDLEETAAVLEHLQRLAVDHGGHAIGDGGYPIMQIHLADGDVDGLMLHAAQPVAATRQRKKAQKQQQGGCGSEAPDGRDEWDWRLREHSRWRSP